MTFCRSSMEGAECIERTNNVIKMKLYTLWLKIREFLMLLGQKIEITAWIERWAVVQIQIERVSCRCYVLNITRVNIVAKGKKFLEIRRSNGN